MLNYEELISKLDLDKEYFYTTEGFEAKDGSDAIIIWEQSSHDTSKCLHTSMNVLKELFENVDIKMILTF